MTEIQLHDSEISAVTPIGGSLFISLSTAYIHESNGVPGCDRGLIWTQSAVIKIRSVTSIPNHVEYPIWILRGSLRIGETIYEEFVPALGVFEGESEFRLELSNIDDSFRESMIVKGGGITIELEGERSSVEEFDGSSPRRSVD